MSRTRQLTKRHGPGEQKGPAKRTKREVLDHGARNASVTGKSYANVFKDVDVAAVFEPGWEEFQDMRTFLKQEMVQEAGMRCGIIKIKCPKEWQPTDSQTFGERFGLHRVKNVGDNQESIPVMKQSFTEDVENEGCFHLIREESLAMHPVDWLLRTQEIKRDVDAEYADTDDPNDIYMKYWKTCIWQTPLYAADVPGSVMKKDLEVAEMGSKLPITYWNLGSECLPCMTRCLGRGRRSIPGVTSPYMYLGSFGTTFGLHTEDADLYSINYLHEGHSKEWIGIPSSHGEKVENVVKKLYRYDEQEKCSAFMRDKSHVIRPDILVKNGVPVFTASQDKGDIIVTFPFAYHEGFNTGFNVAEARNIAFSEWIPYGLSARSCTCSGEKCIQNPFPTELVEEIADKTDHPDFLKYRAFRSLEPAAPYPHPSQKL